MEQGHPKLADIISDPEKVGELPLTEIPRLVGDLEALRTCLLVRLLNPSGNSQGEHHSEGDRRLSVEEAARKMGTSKDWLYRHADGLPFTVRIGRRLGFSEQGIERWMRQRAGR